MELNEKQKQGLEIAIQRYNNGERYTVISGYAGTGKSTLVKFIISALPDIDPEEDVVYTSFTGKATQVLSKKGNKNTSTLHKLLYEWFPHADGTFYRKPVDFIDYKIVVVDEISMVPNDLMIQLAKHENIHVLCLGDPEQLPPVDKSSDNHLLDNPHIFLDEIMRQEEESEIIQLSMKVRKGEPIDFFKGKDVQIIKRSELTTGMLKWADQVLCATNETRIALNNQMRELLGRGDKPEDGDKVICCRNYWEQVCDTEDSSLVNGAIGFLKNSYESFYRLDKKYTEEKRSRDIETINCCVEMDSGDIFSNLILDKKMILEGESSLTWKENYKINKDVGPGMTPLEFTYGYAITGHRSQGSEWDNVLVIEERFPFSVEEHRRWLYTCITRAAKKIVWVRPD